MLASELSVESFIAKSMVLKLSPFETRILSLEKARWKRDLDSVFGVLSENLCLFAGEVAARIGGFGEGDYVNLDVYYTGVKPLVLLGGGFTVHNYGGGQVAEKIMMGSGPLEKRTSRGVFDQIAPPEESSKTFREAFDQAFAATRSSPPEEDSGTSLSTSSRQTKLRVFRFEVGVEPFFSARKGTVEPLHMFLAADSYENVFFKTAIDPVGLTKLSVYWGSGYSYDPRLDRNLTVELDEERRPLEIFESLRETLNFKQKARLRDYWTLVYRRGPWEALARYAPLLSRKELLLRGLFANKRDLFSGMVMRFDALFEHFSRASPEDDSFKRVFCRFGCAEALFQRSGTEKKFALPPEVEWFSLKEHPANLPVADFTAEIIYGASEPDVRPPLVHLRPCLEHEACARDESYCSEGFFCCGYPCANLFKFKSTSEFERRLWRDGRPFVFCLEGEWTGEAGDKKNVSLFVECEPRFLNEKMAILSVLLRRLTNAARPVVRAFFSGRPCHEYRTGVGEWSGSEREVRVLQSFIESTLETCSLYCGCVYKNLK